MKKKLLATLLAVSMVMSLCACGSEKDGAQTTETTAAKEDLCSKDFKASDYVTVGSFEGLEVAVDVYNFTDEDVEKQFDEEVEYYVEYSDLFTYKPVEGKTTVEDGDIVNIDYVGKKDGVAFDGGTAQGHNLEIGSGSFIDGFESGLIGHEVGETTTLNLTFPEGYRNADLAGAAVTFDVTINSINTREMPEITDALVAQMDLGFDTIAAYKDDIRVYLQETCDESNKSERDTAVWEAVYEVCEVKEPPKEFVDSLIAAVKKSAEMYASYYGVSFDEFLTNYMGQTAEQFEAECRTSATENAKQKLAIAAIAEKAGINLSDEDVKAAAEAEYEEYGYTTPDELIASIGQGAYYDYILGEKVYEYLATCVTIKENEPVSVLAEEEEYYEEDLAEEEYYEEDFAEEDGEVIVIDGDEFEGELVEEEFIEEDPSQNLIIKKE